MKKYNKEYMKKWQQNNKEKTRENAKRWYYKNIDKIKEKRNSNEYKEKYREYKRKWARENRKSQKELINNLQSKIDKVLELLEKCLNNYCRNQWEGDWLKLDNPKTGNYYSFEEIFEEIRDILKGKNEN